jgi:hypothetical protein
VLVLGLKARCLQGGRMTGQHVSIIESTFFVEYLGLTLNNMNTTNTISSDDGLVDIEIDVKSVLDNNKDIMKPFSSERMNELRRELGVKNQIKSMEKFIKGGCGKKKMVKLQKRVTELDGRLQKMMSVESTTLDSVLDEAMTMSPGTYIHFHIYIYAYIYVCIHICIYICRYVFMYKYVYLYVYIYVYEYTYIYLYLKPEHQEEGYNALIGMLRAGSTAGREETWERVLLAERCGLK